MNDELGAALVGIAGLLAMYVFQTRHSAASARTLARQTLLRLLEEHSDADEVDTYLAKLIDAVSTRNRLRLSSLVVERAVRQACERVAASDAICAFEASSFLASLDVFERGLERLERQFDQFIDTISNAGDNSTRHAYVRRLIVGQAQILRRDRLTALEAEITLIDKIPGKTPTQFLAVGMKRALLPTLKSRQAQPLPPMVQL